MRPPFIERPPAINWTFAVTGAAHPEMRHAYVVALIQAHFRRLTGGRCAIVFSGLFARAREAHPVSFPVGDRFGRTGPTLFPLQRLRDQPLGVCEAAIRALRASEYLGGDMAVCRVLGRYKMFVDTSDYDISAHLLLDGYWELWVSAIIAQLVRPGMTCVDVGAHLGYFTLLMADLAGPDGRVHAFEPNCALRERLVRSVALNGFKDRVNVYADPLHEQDGLSVRLIVPPGAPGGGHIAADEEGGLRTRRLDGYGDIAGADIVKIDAESSELAIWRGMEGLLSARRPMTVLMEFTRCRYEDAGGFLDIIAKEGFSLALADPQAGLRPVSRAEILAAPAAEDQMLVLRR